MGKLGKGPKRPKVTSAGKELELEEQIDVRRPYKDVNNVAALTQKYEEMVAENPATSFRDTLCIVSSGPVEVADVEDDLKRELAFYEHALQAVLDAQARLDELGVPHRRPDDYFAEMVKTDAHMVKVKGKLIKQQTDAKEAEERRKQRDNKKFGKAVQVAKQQERAQKRKAHIEATKARKRPLGADRDLDIDGGERGGSGRGEKRSKPGSPGAPRAAKEARWAHPRKDKRNSRDSVDSGDRFNAGKWSASGGTKKGPGKKGGAAKQRPGKARRQQQRG